MNAAHLHLMLNHVPVVGALLALPLIAFAVRRGSLELVRVALTAHVAIALLGAAVFLTGEPAEEVVIGLSGVTEAAIERHEEAALIATVLLAVVGALAFATLLRMRSLAPALPLRLLWTLVALATLPVTAMAYTAYLGGEIRHPELRGVQKAQPAAEEVAEIRDPSGSVSGAP